MGESLVAIAILLPVIAGVAAYLGLPRLVRRAVVVGTGIALGAVAIALAAHERLEVDLPALGFDWSRALVALDLLLVVVIAYLAIRTRHRLAIGLAVAQLAVVAYLKLGPSSHSVVHSTFVLDRLSTTLSLIVSIVGSIICVYALRYMDEHEEHHHVSPSRQGRFFFFMLVFLGAMNGLVFANDLGWLFFFWEVTTLCSFMLIGHDGTPVAIANASRALWMNLLGGLGFAGALWLLEARGQETSLEALVGGSADASLVLLPLSLLVFAGMTKAAQMPFQSWLLGAMVAPTPVSALLHSSAMVKAGVYLVVRLAPGYRETALSDVVAFAGAFTFVVAAVLALTSSDGKRVLAYSTISNLGLIIACAGVNTSLALAAALMLILFHAVSKALLFLSVGSIEHAIGSRDIDAMEGLARRHPKLALIAAAGIISMALPPAGVLLSKWVAVEAAASAGASFKPLVTVLFAVGSAATLGFWSRWLGRLFTSPPGVPTSPVRLGSTYALTLGPLVALIAVLSLGAGVIVDSFLEPGMRLYFGAEAIEGAGIALAAGEASYPLGWLYALALVALGVPALAVAVRPARIRPAYFCGENVGGPTDDEFYTAAEQKVHVGIASSHFRALFAEERVVRWGNVVAIVLIALVFGVGYR